jgi:hypothetical protein
VFKFQRGAAAHPEQKQGTDGRQKREHAHEGMAATLETLCFLSFWSLAQAHPIRINQSDDGH